MFVKEIVECHLNHQVFTFLYFDMEGDVFFVFKIYAGILKDKSILFA